MTALCCMKRSVVLRREWFPRRVTVSLGARPVTGPLSLSLSLIAILILTAQAGQWGVSGQGAEDDLTKHNLQPQRMTTRGECGIILVMHTLLHYLCIITSTKEVIFSLASVYLSVSLPVCLFVNKITWKLLICMKSPDNVGVRTRWNRWSNLAVMQNITWNLYCVSDSILPWRRCVLSKCFPSFACFLSVKLL